MVNAMRDGQKQRPESIAQKGDLTVLEHDLSCLNRHPGDGRGLNLATWSTDEIPAFAGMTKREQGSFIQKRSRSRV